MEELPLPDAWIDSITDPDCTETVTEADFTEQYWRQESDGELPVYRYRGHKIQYDPEQSRILGYRNWRGEQLGTWHE